MEIDDKPRWEETKKGDFSTRAIYKLLEANSPYVFPSGNILGVRVRLKLCFFAWEASWEKILALYQLKRRGFSFSNKCFLCHEDEETANRHSPSLCYNSGALGSSFFSF